MQYAEQYHRYLIIDNTFHNFLGMTDDLARYFSSPNKKIQLNLLSDLDLTKLKSTFPIIPKGNIHNYSYYFSKVTGETYFDVGRINPITFNFSNDYREDLLIHHRPGDGPEFALYALSKLKLQRSIATEFLRRYRNLGDHYNAIHIRNTDVTTNYISAFSELKGLAIEKLFIATDSAAVLRGAKIIFGEKVFSYSDIPDLNNQPLHINIDQKSSFLRYQDAICDLLLLGLSSKLYIFKVNPGMRKIYSGFSELALLLNQNKSIVYNLLSTS